MRWLATCAIVVISGAARAIPVDRTLELRVGEPQFVRQSYVEAFEVDPPDLCQAEQMPTYEILLTPKRAGEGLLYLYEDGRLEVFRLVISNAKNPVPPAAPPKDWLKPARAVCPQVEERLVEGEYFLHAQVSDGLCRAALLSVLASNAYTADHLRLVFELPALQAQVGAMQDRLKAAGIEGLTLVYAGASLVMKGKATPELRHRAEKAIWPVTLGRLNVEDDTQPPDAK